MYVGVWVRVCACRCLWRSEEDLRATVKGGFALCRCWNNPLVGSSARIVSTLEPKPFLQLRIYILVVSYYVIFVFAFSFSKSVSVQTGN